MGHFPRIHKGMDDFPVGCVPTDKENFLLVGHVEMREGLIRWREAITTLAGVDFFAAAPPDGQASGA